MKVVNFPNSGPMIVATGTRPRGYPMSHRGFFRAACLPSPARPPVVRSFDEGPSRVAAVMTYFRRRFMNDATETRFLNVDLELLAKQELTELVQAFEPGASALNYKAFDAGFFANLELATQPTEAEAAIRSFVRLIHNLPPRARELWNEASKRDFSIGVEAGSNPSNFELALTPAVLALAAEVGARIVFVVYVHAAASAPRSPLAVT